MKVGSWMRSIFLLLALFGSDLSLAGSSGAVKYLVDEPASMLDIGILRVEMQLESQMEIGALLTPELDKNRFVITSIVRGADKSVEAAKGLCRKVIGDIKDVFLVRAASSFGYSLFAHSFAHRGYSRDTEPEGLLKAIDDMAVIEIISMHSDGRVKCKSELIKEDIYFVD